MSKPEGRPSVPPNTQQHHKQPYPAPPAPSGYYLHGHSPQPHHQQPIGFYPVYPAPQQWVPPQPSKATPPAPTKHKSLYADHPVPLPSMSFSLGAFNPAHGYHPGENIGSSAGNGATPVPSPTHKSPSQAVPIKTPPKEDGELKGLGLTMGPAALGNGSMPLPKPASGVASTLPSEVPAPAIELASSKTADLELPSVDSKVTGALPDVSPDEPSSTESTAEPTTTPTNSINTAPQDSPLPDGPVDDLLGYEPLKPNTISASLESSSPSPAADADDEEDTGVPWYLQPVSKPHLGTALKPLTAELVPRHITLRSPFGMIKRGPVTAWLDVKGEIENFVQQLVADNEHYSTANDKLAIDASNWKSACLLAQRQRDTLQRQVVSETSSNPRPYPVIAPQPLIMADGLDRPLSPTRLSNSSFFDSVVLTEPNVGAPLVRITQVEAEANERRMMEVEKLEKEMEALEAEMLELRKELAEVKDALTDAEEDSKTSYAAILLHADVTMFDYKLIREGRSGGVDTAINISASIYELCGKVFPDGECPDLFSLMIFMDKAAIADELVAYGIISSADTFDAFCEGIAETHGLFIIVDVNGEEDALGKAREHFKWHVNMSACTLLYLATSHIFDFTSLFQLYREEDKLDKVYTADLPELRNKSASFPIRQEQLHHIKLLFPDQKSPSEIAASITAGVQASFGRGTRANGAITDFPTLVPEGSTLGSPSPRHDLHYSSPTAATTELPTRRDVLDSPPFEPTGSRNQQRKREAADVGTSAKPQAYLHPVKRMKQEALEKDWRSQPKAEKKDDAFKILPATVAQALKRAKPANNPGFSYKDEIVKAKRNSKGKNEPRPRARPQYHVPTQGEQWPSTPPATQPSDEMQLSRQVQPVAHQHATQAIQNQFMWSGTQPLQPLQPSQPVQLAQPVQLQQLQHANAPLQQAPPSQQHTQQGYNTSLQHGGTDGWSQVTVQHAPQQNAQAQGLWQNQSSAPSNLQAHLPQPQQIPSSYQQQPNQQYQAPLQPQSATPQQVPVQHHQQLLQQPQQQRQQPQQQVAGQQQQQQAMYAHQLAQQVVSSPPAPPGLAHAQVSGPQQNYEQPAPLTLQQQAMNVYSAPQLVSNVQGQLDPLQRGHPPSQSVGMNQPQAQQHQQSGPQPGVQQQHQQQYQLPQQMHNLPQQQQQRNDFALYHQQVQPQQQPQQQSQQRHVPVQEVPQYDASHALPLHPQNPPVPGPAPPVHPSRQRLVSGSELPRASLSQSSGPPGLPPLGQFQTHFDYRPAPLGQQIPTSFQVVSLPPLPAHATPILQAKVVELDDDEDDGLKPFEVAFGPGESVCGSEHSSPDLPARNVSGPGRPIRRLALPGSVPRGQPARTVTMKRTITINNSIAQPHEEVRNYETPPPKTYPNSTAVGAVDYGRDQVGSKADHHDRHAQFNVVRHQSSQEAYDYVRKLRPRPCNKYYLYGECRTQSCQFGHHYELDQLAYSALGKLTREMVCPELQTGRCHRAESDCIYGHRCPRGLKCQWGDHCWFAHLPDGHPPFTKSSN